MAILEIKTDPDPVLRQKARPVSQVDARIRRLMDDMLETMYSARGIGLAAPQVGISQRVIVIDVGDGPLKVVNPKLTPVGDEEELATEGCLSVPGKQGDVWRACSVLVRGLDENGKPVKRQVEGWLARVFQHEVDHLDGHLFTDTAVDVHEVSPEEEAAEDPEEPSLLRE